jgi:Putative zinc-finger
VTAYGPPGRPESFGPLARHMDAGAYALGVLDEPDETAFERHLAACDVCSARLREFSGLVPVLAELGQEGIPQLPDSSMLDRLLAEVAEQRRVKRRRRRLAGVAAAALIVAGPTAAVLSAQESPPPAASQPVAIQHSANDPGTGVSATVGLTAKAWGTKVDMKLSNVEGPLTCSLVAVGRHGERQTAATWTVPDKGYGADGKPKPFSVSGAIAMATHEISRFVVVTDHGRQLISVPT